jgi:ABC-type protease/lipase transport system fused ATPase/permease subunit
MQFFPVRSVSAGVEENLLLARIFYRDPFFIFNPDPDRMINQAKPLQSLGQIDP